MLYSSPEEGRYCRGIGRALLRIIILIPEIPIEIIYGEQTSCAQNPEGTHASSDWS